MARKDDALGVSGFETVIGAGVVVRGHLTSEGDVLINGAIDGDVHTTGDVTIGGNGHLKGNITALNVTVAGQLEGNILAEGEVGIRETGRVHGDITAAGLSITSGGMFSGRSIRQNHHELADPAPGNEEA